MSDWIANKLMWIAGAVAALAIFYFIGRRDGKANVELKQKEKELDALRIAKRIDDMSDSDIERMPSKYD